jgi:hypothetical protein
MERHGVTMQQKKALVEGRSGRPSIQLGSHDSGDGWLTEVVARDTRNVRKRHACDLPAVRAVVIEAEAVNFVESAREGEGFIALIANLLLTEQFFLGAGQFFGSQAVPGEFANLLV